MTLTLTIPEIRFIANELARTVNYCGRFSDHGKEAMRIKGKLEGYLNEENEESKE